MHKSWNVIVVSARTNLSISSQPARLVRCCSVAQCDSRATPPNCRLKCDPALPVALVLTAHSGYLER
jgi:hypothetical protein